LSKIQAGFIVGVTENDRTCDVAVSLFRLAMGINALDPGFSKSSLLRGRQSAA